MRISDWSSDVCSSDLGGWLTDPALLDRLVDEKLKAEGTRILAAGWKWVTTSIDLPWDATRDLRAIDRDEVAMSDDEQAPVAAVEAAREATLELWGPDTRRVGYEDIRWGRSEGSESLVAN